MKLLKFSLLLIMSLGISLSACSSKVAFTIHEGQSNFQIYTINPDGSEISQLTNIGVNGSPAWSPDGNKIAFSSSRTGDWAMFVMNNDGSNQVKLTDSTNDGAGPVWSPDSSKIAFVSNRDNPDGKFDLYVMNFDGTGRQRLTYSPGTYYGYSWSVNGQKITFASMRDDVGADIYVINADGSNEINLTNSPQNEVEPLWSPDGHKIMFTSYLKDDIFRALIYTMNIDGSHRKRLTDDTTAQIEDNYSWSPDGDHILYDSAFDIFIINADGTNRRNLTSTFDGICNLPTWSPNGRKVSFRCWPPEPHSPSNIWIANVSNGKLEEVTNSTEDVGIPVWSPWLK